jgi:cell division protein FtsW
MARKLQSDEWLFAVTVALALFGVIMVYSASAVVAVGQKHGQYYYAARQAIWTVIGFTVMLAAARIDYRWLRSGVVAYGLLFLTIALLASVFAFPEINGARRWIRIANFFSVQPSELAKLTLVIFLARLLERRAGDEGNFWRTLFPCVLVAGLLVLLVVAEPDLGTALMLGVIALVVLYTAGARIKQLAIVMTPALVGLTGLLLFVPWRLQRLAIFLDPWSDPRGAGYQIIQSLLAVGSGGVNGLGFTEGRQKLFFLPFAHSDFIFAVVGEELGLLGGLGVVFLFGLFLWRGLRAAVKAPDRFGMLLGTGIVTGIVAQALFNMSVVLALVPTKGIPLPFISYGGSSLVPTLFAVGVLLNISQHAGLSEIGSNRGWDVETRGRGDAALESRAASTASSKRPATAGTMAGHSARPPASASQRRGLNAASERAW